MEMPTRRALHRPCPSHFANFGSGEHWRTTRNCQGPLKHVRILRIHELAIWETVLNSHHMTESGCFLLAEDNAPNTNGTDLSPGRAVGEVDPCMILLPVGSCDHVPVFTRARHRILDTYRVNEPASKVSRLSG